MGSNGQGHAGVDTPMLPGAGVRGSISALAPLAGVAKEAMSRPSVPSRSMTSSSVLQRPVNECRCHYGRQRLFEPPTESEGAELLVPRPKEAPSVRGEPRRDLWQQAGGRCAYCDEEVDFLDMEVDHQDCWARGGLHCRCNWACSCLPCNRTKSDAPFAPWQRLVEDKRRRRATEADPVAMARSNAEFEAKRKAHQHWVGSRSSVQDHLFGRADGGEFGQDTLVESAPEDPLWDGPLFSPDMN